MTVHQAMRVSGHAECASVKQQYSKQSTDFKCQEQSVECFA